MELAGHSSATPVKLYDGGDLGISDCKRMKLSYLGWAESMSSTSPDGTTVGDPTGGDKRRLLTVDSGVSYEPTMTTVQLTDHRECMERYHMVAGNVYDELAGMGKGGGVSRSEICVAVPKTDPPTGPCFGDVGLPLTASKIKGREGSWLLGLSHADHCSDGQPLPAVFTRVSSSLQWILATVKAPHPEQFTMNLDIMELGLPEGANLTVHHGPYFSETNLVEDGVLDSKCMVPWGTMTGDGAMLIMLHMPTHVHSCDKECVDTMGFTAKFGLAECEHCTDDCKLSVPWDKMGPEFEDKGKGFTGGLGKRLVKRADKDYGVWACVRDWDAEEQMACGAQHNELACFWFEVRCLVLPFVCLVLPVVLAGGPGARARRRTLRGEDGGERAREGGVWMTVLCSRLDMSAPRVWSKLSGEASHLRFQGPQQGDAPRDAGPVRARHDRGGPHAPRPHACHLT